MTDLSKANNKYFVTEWNENVHKYNNMLNELEHNLKMS